MRKSFAKWIVFIVTFCASLFIISLALNKGNTDMTTKMQEATNPIAYVLQRDERINCMHAYVEEMDVSSQKEHITPLTEKRAFSFEIQKYGVDIGSLSFQVRSANGERLIENTPIYNYLENKDRITADITLKDLIEENLEYNIVIILESKEGEKYYFYTKVIYGDEYHLEDKLDFVQMFHNKTFRKDEAKDISRYLESNQETDNTTLNKVTINSSLKQVTWGDLEVTRIDQPQITIQELGKQTASIKYDFYVMTEVGGTEQTYRVEEYFRVRYGSERMYLLDYERNMYQMFVANSDTIVNNKIILGIADANLDMKESNGGKIVAFVYENQLYSYNAVDNKLTRLFSFYDTNNDYRTTFQGHEIKILNIEETGNVRFMVYGYMNRGRYEGKVGIQVYFYNSAVNTIEEEVFIPSTKSYQMVMANVDQLAYVSNTNNLYLMMDASLYSIDLLNHTSELVVSNLDEESFQVSSNEEMIVWQESSDVSQNDSLILMNLSTKKQTKIVAGEGRCIKPLGFMEQDLIFGIAYKNDVVLDPYGRTVFPMYEVKIQDEQGNILKSYNQPGIYITDSLIEKNQITLKRYQKLDEDGSGVIRYQAIEDDHILNNELETKGSNFIEVVAVDNYQKIVQIALEQKISYKSLKYVFPQEVLYEGNRQILLNADQNAPVPNRYYVYGKKGIEGIYSKPNHALNHANNIAGVVMNNAGNYVWKKGNTLLKNQIMAITATPVTEGKSSIGVCLDSILKFEGISRNTDNMLREGQDVLHILKSNLPDADILDLSGCSLDNILYYPNREVPVLALLKNGNAVLIVGYNELNVVIMDPQTGTIYKKGMNDSRDWFDENGNVFITYIPKED